MREFINQINKLNNDKNVKNTRHNKKELESIIINQLIKDLKKTNFYYNNRPNYFPLESFKADYNNANYSLGMNLDKESYHIGISDHSTIHINIRKNQKPLIKYSDEVDMSNKPIDEIEGIMMDIGSNFIKTFGEIVLQERDKIRSIKHKHNATIYSLGKIKYELTGTGGDVDVFSITNREGAIHKIGRDMVKFPNKIRCCNFFSDSDIIYNYANLIDYLSIIKQKKVKQ